VYKNFVVGSR